MPAMSRKRILNIDDLTNFNQAMGDAKTAASAQITGVYDDLTSRINSLVANPQIPQSAQNQINSKADKAYVDDRFTNLINGSPAALNTLKELSDALGADPHFATTIATAIGSKADANTVTNQLAQKADLSVTTSLANRITQTENNLSSLSGRVSAMETWRGAKAAFLGAAIAGDLKTDWNVVTTVLGTLVGAINITNAKVNALAGKIISIQTALQGREITATA